MCLRFAGNLGAWTGCRRTLDANQVPEDEVVCHEDELDDGRDGVFGDGNGL
jgi:hypothetical protein